MIRKYATIIAISMLVWGITYGQGFAQYPELTYKHYPSIRLAVNTIVIDQTYRQPMPNLPIEVEHVDHLSPLNPSQSIKRWAEQRLQAAGGDYNARVAIIEASMLKVPLEKDESFIGWFKDELGHRYDLTLDVFVEVLDPRGFVVASANSVVRRSISLPESASLAETQDAWFKMTETAMQDLNEELPNAMYEYLGLFILKDWEGESVAPETGQE